MGWGEGRAVGISHHCPVCFNPTEAHRQVTVLLIAQRQTHGAYRINFFLISCGLPHFLALIFGNPPFLLGDHI